MDPDEEKSDDWNYWVVILCPDVGPWWIRKVIPHWGLYRPPGPVCHIGEPLPDAAYQPPPPPDNPPYQPASSSWE